MFTTLTRRYFFDLEGCYYHVTVASKSFAFHSSEMVPLRLAIGVIWQLFQQKSRNFGFSGVIVDQSEVPVVSVASEEPKSASHHSAQLHLGLRI